MKCLGRDLPYTAPNQFSFVQLDSGKTPFPEFKYKLMNQKTSLASAFFIFMYNLKQLRTVTRLFK